MTATAPTRSVLAADDLRTLAYASGLVRSGACRSITVTLTALDERGAAALEHACRLAAVRLGTVAEIRLASDRTTVRLEAG